MKRINKIVATLVLGMGVAIVPVQQAFAKANAYLIKDSSASIVYEYDKTVLSNALVNDSLNGSDPYFQNFDQKRAKYSLYAFHSDSNKYVSFESAKNALIDYTLEKKEFDLDTYLDLATTPELKITAPIKSVVMENGTVKYVDKSAGTEDSLEIISIE